MIVKRDEVGQCLPEIIKGLVDPPFEDLLLEGLPEPFDDAVGLGFSDIS